MKRILLLITLILLGRQILLIAQASDAGALVSLNGNAADSLLQTGSVMDSLFYAADSVAYHYSSERIELSG
jgi:hypothetical protein